MTIKTQELVDIYEDIRRRALYHVVDYWRTPASSYPRATEGEWSITTRTQLPGVYSMQNPGDFYYHRNQIDLTVLKEGERVWFTDEPRQLYALADIGLFRAYGHVVVGGLGLGLIHSFLRQNPNVDSVLTIERAGELERLVWPHVRCGALKIGDFYEELPLLAQRGYQVDAIITDFIFGEQGENTWAELQEQRRFCASLYPKAAFLEHGYQHRMDREAVHSALPGATLGGLVTVARAE